MKAQRSVLLLITCALFSGCDMFYGPCIANGYTKPAAIKATYADGLSGDATLPSGTVFWQRASGRRLVALSFTTDGERHAYAAATLDRLRAQHPVKEELWVVEPRGVKLEDLHNIREIRKRLPQPPKT